MLRGTLPVCIGTDLSFDCSAGVADASCLFDSAPEKSPGRIAPAARSNLQKRPCLKGSRDRSSKAASASGYGAISKPFLTPQPRQRHDPGLGLFQAGAASAAG